MKFRWPWAKKGEEEISSIESMLESLYKPVSARPAFVDELRQKLVGVRGPLGVAGRSTLELILLIGGAIIGLAVFILASIRAVLTLLAGIRFIGGKVQKKRKEEKMKMPSSAKPAVKKEGSTE